MSVSPPAGMFVEIAANTARRGYREGWSQDQFLGRQVVKLLEEACEALEASGLPDTPASQALLASVGGVKALAKQVFKEQEPWSQAEGYVSHEVTEEMADCLVVIANYAAVSGENLLLRAYQKSESDIIRGAG